MRKDHGRLRLSTIVWSVLRRPNWKKFPGIRLGRASGGLPQAEGSGFNRTASSRGRKSGVDVAQRRQAVWALLRAAVCESMRRNLH